MVATTMVKLSCVVLVFAQMALSSADDCDYGKLNQLERKMQQLKAEVIQNQQRLGHGLAIITDQLSGGSSGAPIVFPGLVAAESEATNCVCPDQPVVPAKIQVGGVIDSCAEANDRGLPTGSYTLQLPGDGGEQFEAYCDQDTQDGGWMVIQNRVDERLSFEKSWRHYRKGFGDPKKNYWIGLDTLHRLTNNGGYELRIELIDKTGKELYAAYGDFQVGSPSEYYKLKKIGTYSGTAGDSLYYHVGAKFSTYDTDNDSSGVNCASETKGGWWLFGCQGSHYCNLNGVYDGASQQGIVWYGFAGYTGLAGSRMLIREK